MNSDNPYAAPQTIEFRSTGELPVADAVGRQLFPDLTTAQLSRLADYSHTMQLMTSLWVILLLSLCLMLPGFNSYQPNMKGFLSISILLIVLRFVGGRARGRRWRYYTGFLDGVFFASLLLGMTAGFITMPDLMSLMLFLPLCLAIIFLSIIAFTSCLAHCCAPELFGAPDYPHHALMQEIDYRKQYGIA